jgi:hypothetical protein
VLQCQKRQVVLREKHKPRNRVPAQKPLSRIEVPYFIAADREPPLDTIKNGSSTVEDPSMPCEWRGSFAAVAPWSKAYSSDTHTHASAHSRK